MADWIVYAIWVLMGLWTFMQIRGVWILATNPGARYNKFGVFTNIAWVISMVFWVSFRIFG